MYTIVLQEGHINIEKNVDPSLRSGTGTDGEQELTQRIAIHLAALLRQKGFDVTIVDANANDGSLINTNYDFFLAIHGDANVYGTGGGFITAPDPAYDAVNEKSIAIANEIARHYFSPYTEDTGIVEHLERNNPNATKYYMWDFLSANTPCALIELGVVKDAHDNVILADSNRVVNALARGICSAFGVTFDTTPPPSTTLQLPTPPSDPCAVQNQKIADLEKINAQQLTTISKLNVAIYNYKKALAVALTPKPQPKVAIDYIAEWLQSLRKGGK